MRRHFAGYKLRDKSVGVAFNDEAVRGLVQCGVVICLLKRS